MNRRAGGPVGRGGVTHAQDIVSFGEFTSGQFSWQKYALKAIGLGRLPACHPARQCRGPVTVPHTAIENMVLAVGDNAVTYYRQSLYNANRPARHPATMTGYRQPEFAIGKVLIRLKVTRFGSATGHPL